MVCFLKELGARRTLLRNLVSGMVHDFGANTRQRSATRQMSREHDHLVYLLLNELTARSLALRDEKHS